MTHNFGRFSKEEDSVLLAEYMKYKVSSTNLYDYLQVPKSTAWLLYEDHFWDDCELEGFVETMLSPSITSRDSFIFSVMEAIQLDGFIIQQSKYDCKIMNSKDSDIVRVSDQGLISINGKKKIYHSRPFCYYERLYTCIIEFIKYINKEDGIN